MGVDGYAIRGLRKNAAAALADVACTPHEIAAITGHRTLGDGAHYAQRHDQRLAARSAKDKLERAQIANSRTERDNSCGKPIDN